MHDDPRIEQRIRDILAGSGLPALRRKEVADELRGHLEQLVEAKIKGGMEERAAIQAAMALFGEPSPIRRRLRSEAMRLRSREALTLLRGRMPVLMIGALLPITYVVISGFLGCGCTGKALLCAMAAGTIMYAFLVAALVLVLYPFLLLRVRVHHPLPRAELRICRRLGYWSAAIYGAIMGAQLLLAAGFILGVLVMSQARIDRVGLDFAGFAVNCLRREAFLPTLVPVAIVALLTAAVLTRLELRHRSPEPMITDS